MEDLKRLEKVQKMLCFIDSRGLSTTHLDSDRFLANFLLFLVEPSEKLNLQKRYEIVSEHMHKLSPTILEDALFYVTEGHEKKYSDAHSSLNLDNKLNFQLSKLDKCQNTAMIGFECMQRANSTLEDFVHVLKLGTHFKIDISNSYPRSYFMFHEMDADNAHTLFMHLPVLSFTESYIYELDAMNERSLQTSLKEMNSKRSNINHSEFISNRVTINGGAAPTAESFGPLIHLLQSRGLLTKRIENELESGIEYWELERKLCHALTGNQMISIEDVMRAVYLKSFDYRVLNLLLYQLRHQQVNDLHMEFLSISEFLVEVSDDLYDYEEDVIDNTFNILRMYVRAYGASAAPHMLAKCIAEAEEKYEKLLKALDPELSSRYSRRCEEATKEGGSTSGHAFGTWNVPPIIVDEDSFRVQTSDNPEYENS